MRALRCIPIAAAAALLLGCASSPPRQSAGRGAGVAGTSAKTAALPGKPGCFWLRDFQGSWTVLNDTEIIVYAPLDSTPYLVKLFQPVPTLKFRERLGFTNDEHTGMICNDTMDAVVVPHWEPHRIPIVAVRQLTVPEADGLLVANHIKPPPSAKPAKGTQAAKP